MVRGMKTRFDRTADDVGNIIKLEHVNLTVPDQRIATLFYVSGLGLTRDPYLMTGVENMWINVGDAQFHLPTREPQRFRGVIALVVPDLAALLVRLRTVAPMLTGTQFAFREHEHAVEATCPWGNRIRCHAPDAARFGTRAIGMPYLEFDVPPGSADGIAAFYRDVMASPARVEARTAIVTAGPAQTLRFRETDAAPEHYDGHHIQVYVADFSGPHRRLLERDLVSEESDEHQYRFLNIVDPRDNKTRFTIEHEVRSLRHPLYGRAFVNRNATQTNRAYVPGQDAF